MEYLDLWGRSRHGVDLGSSWPMNGLVGWEKEYIYIYIWYIHLHVPEERELEQAVVCEDVNVWQAEAVQPDVLEGYLGVPADDMSDQLGVGWCVEQVQAP